ncbi:MAG: hypothetical protein FJ125_18720, partial [Deltaproteobacteria bacterium]|nr:hypothetical protein [Deltaproteobacteria bacterium]
MRTLLTQLPLPSPIHEADDANQPLAAGLLLSHAARAGALDGVEARILPVELASTAGDRALVAAIADFRPDLVGFSTTMWNVDRTLWVARRLREVLPGVQVVLGGPEVTPDNERLLAATGWDVLAFGEGERSFGELLRWLRSGRAAGALPLSGLLVRDAAQPGEPQHGGPRAIGAPPPPLSDLDDLQPYLEGWLPVPVGSEALLETTRGCRHRCRYCYYAKAHHGVSYLSLPALRRQVRFLREQGVR